MKKYLKIILCFVLCGTMLFAIGCKKKGEEGDGKSPNVRIFTYSGQEFEAVQMDSVMQKVEEKTGVKLCFEGANAEDYYTKLGPMMSTGDWPDLIWSDPKNSGGSFQTWSDPQQDILYNLDDLLIGKADRYPYLTDLIYSKQYKNIMYHGGHYLIPQVNTKTAWAIYYRGDWLKQIGYVDKDGNPRAPETLDEFEDVMKKFSGKDLFVDENGTKSGQTYGISPNTQNFYVNPLYGAFGITPDWDVDENKEISYMYAREQFKPYLKWMNAMYKKGWIDPVFNQNIGFNDREAWYDGKVGCIMTNGENHMEWVVGNFEGSQGVDKVVIGPPPVGTGNTSTLTNCMLGVKGERGFSDWGGYYGGYAITKGAKDPYKVLDLMEYLVSEEGGKLRLYGIKDKHYTEKDGIITADIDGRNQEMFHYFGDVKNEDGSVSCGGFHNIGSRFGYTVDWKNFRKTGEIMVGTNIGSLYPKYGKYVSKAVEYTKYLQSSVLENVTAFPSTIDIQIADVMNITSLFINKAIVGAKNLDGDWDQMIAEINKAGYNQVKQVIKETIVEMGII